MPYFAITTNKRASGEQKDETLKAMHKLVAKELGKPDQYIMTAIKDQVSMHFGNADEPLAFVEFKSIGLPDTQKLSATICDFIYEHLQIDLDRIYIEFTDEPRNMFGYNRKTFAPD